MTGLASIRSQNAQQHPAYRPVCSASSDGSARLTSLCEVTGMRGDIMQHAGNLSNNVQRHGHRPRGDRARKFQAEQASTPRFLSHHHAFGNNSSWQLVSNPRSSSDRSWPILHFDLSVLHLSSALGGAVKRRRVPALLQQRLLSARTINRRLKVIRDRDRPVESLCLSN
jgi:hypothetical protein